ncbi:hemin uptake protein HemP [Chitinimonas sp. BJYL2]|uniref:hemin uptake protein HemP n=1 Tax=Chitinimonas sp. BJYL2 TaxID=2976696 RepID=UPI0022B33AC3|nr:hemin uptake protein HemP [Chitinimonas sp. BJYL2]
MSTTKPTPSPAPTPAVLDAQALLGQRNEVVIRHREETYRLRLTRNGKLILTK